MTIIQRISLLGGLALVSLSMTAPAWAQNGHLSMPSANGSATTATAVPTRGHTMKQVRARFGAPEKTHPAVGEPPITRWDYPGFVVVFEHNLVLNSVLPGEPSPLYHRDQLTRR